MATSRQRGNDIGVVGKRVGERVRRVRQHRELTQDQLSRAMTALGRPIPTASIGRLESGDRRVDVDDLLALAYALDVSPLSLLLPFTESPETEVSPAGVGRTMDALSAWLWAVGVEPHWYVSANSDSQMSEWRGFRERSHPWWLQIEAGLNERLIESIRNMPDVPKHVAERPDWLYDEGLNNG